MEPLTPQAQPISQEASHSYLERKLNRKLKRSGILIMNSLDGDILPGSFRASHQVFLPSRELDLTGLGDLHISGSSQPSQLGFRAIKARVPRHMTVVNLKQEDGLFIEPRKGEGGALAFSYLMSMPWWVKEDREPEAIDTSEQRRCSLLQKKHKVTVYGIEDDNNLRKEKHTVLYEIRMKAKRIFTEKELCQEEGFSYLRIPDKKFGHMEYKHVDQMVDFVKHLPEGEHVHFHCKRGQSRTTLFMTMFDMLKNADHVACEDIIKRQGPKGLGGADLTKLPKVDSWEYGFKKGWLDFLHTFYQYVRENKPLGFEKSWSVWAEEQGIEQPEEVPLDHYEGSTMVSALTSPSAPKSSEADVERPYFEERSEKPLVLVTSNEDKVSVSNFRSMQDHQLDPSVHINMVGLQDLRASASSQYSKIALSLLMKKLQSQTEHITLCDLRDDDHLFVDGKNVSDFQTRRELLRKRTQVEIIEAVERLKSEILSQEDIKLHAIDTAYPSNEFSKRFSIKFRPQEVLTPAELVESMKGSYLRIGTKRFSENIDEDIDHLLTHIESMPEDSWIHFSDIKGKGRTTFFMALYDLLHNADKVSWEDIIQRQHLIGGSNLFDITPKDRGWAPDRETKRQRVITLARFAEFAKEYIAKKERGEALPHWRSWSEEHPLVQPVVDHLLFDRTEPRADRTE